MLKIIQLVKVAENYKNKVKTFNHAWKYFENVQNDVPRCTLYQYRLSSVHPIPYDQRVR